MFSKVFCRPLSSKLNLPGSVAARSCKQVSAEVSLFMCGRGWDGKVVLGR